MIECKDVEYILAIAKHQSISQAARELYISQPALTKYLQSLEARLGVTLFNRSKKTLTTTLAGERYIFHAAEISTIKHQLEQEIERLKSESSGSLRVGFSCTGLRDVIYETITQLRKVEPTLQTDFRELTSPEIERLVQDYQLDIGFISMPCPVPELQCEVFYEEDILLCVPASNSLSTLGKQVKDSPYPWIDLSLFKDEPFILRNPGTRFRTLTDRLFEEYSIVSPVTVMTSRNQFTSVEFAEMHQLSTFITASFIKNFVNPGAFRFFLVGSQVPKLVIGSIHRRGELLSIPAYRMLHIMNGIIRQQRQDCH